MAIALMNVTFVPVVAVELLLHPAERLAYGVALLGEADVYPAADMLGFEQSRFYEHVYLLTHPRIRGHIGVDR